MGAVNLPEQASQLPSPAAVYLSSLAAGSRPAMRQSLRRVAGENFHEFPWHELRHSHVAAIRAQLVDDGLAPATANKILTAVRGTMRAAWRMGRISSEDYHRAVDVPRVRGQSVPGGRVLTPEEVAELYQATGADPDREHRDRVMLDLLYGAGLRRAEAAALRWEDVSYPTLLIRGKGAKERLCYLPDRCWNRLADYRTGFADLNPEDPVLGLQANGIYDRVRWLRAESGIELCTPHDLRRTYATRLYEKTHDLEVVSQLLGHANPITTRRYLRLGEVSKREAVAQIEVPL